MLRSGQLQPCGSRCMLNRVKLHIGKLHTNRGPSRMVVAVQRDQGEKAGEGPQPNSWRQDINRKAKEAFDDFKQSPWSIILFYVFAMLAYWIPYEMLGGKFPLH